MKIKSIDLKNTTKVKWNKHTHKEMYGKKCDIIHEFTCMSSNSNLILKEAWHQTDKTIII
jgi:hypothetical protein